MKSVILYRPEVDGLRAISVFIVVFYHAGINGFSGGYIGVDIFFVISGFLITSIIKKEIENNEFSLINFYERRFRRIIPALFFMVSLCIFIFPFFLLPRELKDFSESLVSLALFSSNFLFWWETGYFNPTAEYKPLIHTWSLAVEEQFYLFWPIIMLWIAGRKKIIVPLMIALVILSLIMANNFTVRGGSWATASFYFLITRVWELLAGSIVAFMPTINSPRWKELFSWFGAFLLSVSLFIFDKFSAHPSFLTTIPVLGSALCLLASNNTVIGKFLSLKPLVQIGLTSYSVYLWHQPVFALAHLNSLRELTLNLKVSLIVLSFGIGYFSWRWIEAPFRNKVKVSSLKVFALFFIFTCVTASIGMYGFINYDKIKLGPKIPANVEYRNLGEKIKIRGRVCDLKLQPSGLSLCTFGDRKGNEKVILIGDSHAQAISYELDSWLSKNQIAGIFVEVTNCETLPKTARDQTYDNTCPRKYDELYSFLRDQNSTVIVANRWAMKLYPTDGVRISMPFENSEGYNETDLNYTEFSVVRNGSLSTSKKDKEWVLNTFIGELSAAAERVFIVYPIPETGIDVEKFNRFYQRLNGDVPDEISFPIDDYLVRNEFVVHLFDELIFRNPKVAKLDISDFLCSRDTKRCLVQQNKIPFYYDDDHLSSAGAREIIRLFADSYTTR